MADPERAGSGGVDARWARRLLVSAAIAVAAWVAAFAGMVSGRQAIWLPGVIVFIPAALGILACRVAILRAARASRRSDAAGNA